MESHAPANVDSILTVINTFLDFAGLTDWKVRPPKIQRKVFSRPEKELTREEHRRLVTTAEREKNCRLSLLLQIIYVTGIRVSELPFITVEALQIGQALVDCKDKTRTVFLPTLLVRTLHSYCRKQRIKSGTVFYTRNDRPIDRSNIWRGMKILCKSAGVTPGKVSPHSLRHLFARTYHDLKKGLSKLTDLLRHVNISAAGTYTMENGERHTKQLDKIGLVPTRLQGRQHNDDCVVEYNEINRLLHTRYYHTRRRKAKNHRRIPIASMETRQG